MEVIMRSTSSIRYLAVRSQKIRSVVVEDAARNPHKVDRGFNNRLAYLGRIVVRVRLHLSITFGVEPPGRGHQLCHHLARRWVQDSGCGHGAGCIEECLLHPERGLRHELSLKHHYRSPN